MPARLSWRHLIPGIIALAAVAAVALGVAMFAGIGQMRGETMTLYASSSQARGVLHGTEVWLAGQKIGVVERVSFQPATTDTSARVLITMTVRRSDAEQIRADSRADIHSGFNVIGPVVVAISSGTPRAARIHAGDTLRAGAQSDVEVAATKMKAAIADVGPIVADARTILKRVHDPNGTVGAVLTEGIGGNGAVAHLRAQVAALRATMFGGVAGATSRRATLMAQASTALSRVDSIRSLLASTQNSYGRFHRDSTLKTSVARIRDDLGVLRARLDSGGTLGRMQTDSALTRSVAAARAEMAALFQDISQHPLHYVYIF